MDKHRPSGMMKIPDAQNFQRYFDEKKKCSELEQIHRSFQIHRSPNSATFLFLGLSNAGISHTINVLANQSAIPIGKHSDNLLGLTFELKSSTLRIDNAKIYMIDTPGFGDTYNEFNPEAYKNVLQYFQTQGYLPNMIFLVVNITEKRLESKSGRFIKLLDRLKSELGSLVDTKNPNVMVILTHLCSASDSIQMDPVDIVQIVDETVREHLQVSAVAVAVAENRAEGYNLHKVNGQFWVLPNAVLYPRNVFLTLLGLVENLDPVGHSLIKDMRDNFDSLANTRMEKFPIPLPACDIVVWSPGVSYDLVDISFSEVNGAGEKETSFDWSKLPDEETGIEDHEQGNSSSISETTSWKNEEINSNSSQNGDKEAGEERYKENEESGFASSPPFAEDLLQMSMSLNESFPLLKKTRVENFIEETLEEERQYFLETEIVQIIEKKAVPQDIADEEEAPTLRRLASTEMAVEDVFQTEEAGEEISVKPTEEPIVFDRISATIKELGTDIPNCQEEEILERSCRERNFFEKQRIQFAMFTVLGLGVAGLAVFAPKLYALLRPM